MTETGWGDQFHSAANAQERKKRKKNTAITVTSYDMHRDHRARQARAAPGHEKNGKPLLPGLEKKRNPRKLKRLDRVMPAGGESQPRGLVRDLKKKKRSEEKKT